MSLPVSETRSAVTPEVSPTSADVAYPQRQPGWRARLLDRIRSVRLTEAQTFLLLAILIGLFSGALVVCFQIAIEWTRLWLLGSGLAPSHARLLLVPSLAGFVVAVLVMRVFHKVRGSGVNQTKAAVYVFDGYVPFSTVIGKFITCAIAIGSGQSLGPEDPSLQIGAGIASAFGRWLKLSRDKVRLIAPVGAAAGLAAAFNAPISSVLFVIEEVIGKWSAGVLGAIVLAALSSVVVMRNFLGAEPLFRVTSYRLGHPSELVAYAVLGLVGGFASLVLLRLIAELRPRLMGLPRRTKYLQPAVAGLLIGLMGFAFPQVLGAGYQTIDEAMHGQYLWQALALLALFKIAATVLSFSSGTPGGLFAPSLFVGCMLGGAVGGIEHHFFPNLTGSVGAYALVGMGTIFAGFLRVPMTSVFMVLELSGNYSIIIPVIISNTIAYVISRKYQKVPLFDMLSRQEGMDLPSMEAQREESALRVENAIIPYAAPVLRGAQTVQDALESVRNVPDEFLLLNLGEQGWSGVTRELLQVQLQLDLGDRRLSDLPERQRLRLPHVHLDQPLDVPLRCMDDHPLLPVVSRANLQKVDGVVTLSSIMAAYQIAYSTGASELGKT